MAVNIRAVECAAQIGLAARVAAFKLFRQFLFDNDIGLDAKGRQVIALWDISDAYLGTPWVWPSIPPSWTEWPEGVK